MIEKYNLGDTIEMKKEHPCHKAKTWVVVRVGVDVKIKCDGCGAVIMMERPDFERKCKRLIHKTSHLED